MEFKFFGSVVPKRLKLEIDNKETILCTEPNGLEYSFNFRISKGKIRGDCKAKGNDEAFLELLLLRIQESITAVVDIEAFKIGVPTITLINTIKLNGVKKEYMLAERSVQKFCTSLANPEDESAIRSLVLGNLNIRLALRDLVQSLHTLNYSAIATARAVDAIRGYLSKNKGRESWKKMRLTLNLSEDYLKYITDASKEPRHGNRGAASDGQTQVEVTHRGWTVMDRFFHFYLGGGSEPLPTDKFPIL